MIGYSTTALGCGTPLVIKNQWRMLVVVVREEPEKQNMSYGHTH